MSLERMTGRGQTPSAAAVELANQERFLTLAVEGAALGVPEIDAAMYQQFRANVARIAQQLPDRLPDEEKLAQIRAVMREFEGYRKAGEEELRNRTMEWRSMASLLFRELLKALGIDAGSTKPDELARRIAAATSAQKVLDLREQLESFLHPAGADSRPAEASRLQAADHSTANDNAA